MASATDIVRERAIHTTAVSKEALVSKSYFYPPLGVAYMLYQPQLWPPLLDRVLPCALLSIGVLVPMFLFTYIPQAAILTVMNGPAGPINAVALVLSESSVLINWLARSFFLEKTLVEIFDATLVCEGQETLVAKGRELRPGNKSQGAKKLGKAIMQPMHKYTFSSMMEYVMLLPLNLIPFVGTAVFLIVQGRKIGPTFHARYFQLKQFDESYKNAFIKSHRGGYIAFGTMAMAMNLIPLTTILFTVTSTVGAALWAAEVEKKAGFPGEKVDLKGEESGGPIKKEL